VERRVIAPSNKEVYTNGAGEALPSWRLTTNDAGNNKDDHTTSGDTTVLLNDDESTRNLDANNTVVINKFSSLIMLGEMYANALDVQATDVQEVDAAMEVIKERI
jgi:hypothetical protein